MKKGTFCEHVCKVHSKIGFGSEERTWKSWQMRSKSEGKFCFVEDATTRASEVK
jgi:hypothetical protein